jgi:hypothetical protein
VTPLVMAVPIGPTFGESARVSGVSPNEAEANALLSPNGKMSTKRIVPGGVSGTSMLVEIAPVTSDETEVIPNPPLQK